MLEIKKLKPIGCQVLVTKNIYKEDDYLPSGISIVHPKGSLKSYQTVLAVGDDVKAVAPGDVVEINFYKYCEFENDESSIKVNGSNKIVNIRLNEVTLIDDDGNPLDCFLIDQRDIKYVLTDFVDKTYKRREIKETPKKKLILPDQSIRL